MRVGSIKGSQIIQTPEPWIPVTLTRYAADATPVTSVVPIAEYPGYYHYVALDARDVAKNGFKTRGWYLITARSQDGGKTFDDFEAWYQIAAKQPAFPVSWAAAVEATKKYVAENACQYSAEGCPPETSLWRWIGAGAAIGAVTLLLGATLRTRRK